MGSHALVQGDLPHAGVEPASPVWQVDTLPLNHRGSPDICILYCIFYCFLCIQKDADSKLICEYFLSVYIVHHFLADKRSGILYLAMQEAQGLGPL